MLPTHGPFLLIHVARTNSSYLSAHRMQGGTGSLHSTHTPERPCVDVPAGTRVTAIQPCSLLSCWGGEGGLETKKLFPGPSPAGFLGSAKERPWCNNKRQEKGQNLAHPCHSSWPGSYCYSRAGPWAQGSHGGAAGWGVPAWGSGGLSCSCSVSPGQDGSSFLSF